VILRLCNFSLCGDSRLGCPGRAKLAGPHSAPSIQQARREEEEEEEEEAKEVSIAKSPDHPITQ
jgi:hypothetical protein